MFRLKSPVIFNQERLPYLIIPQSPTSRIEPGLDISTVSTDCEITAKSAAKYPVEADSINDLQASHINKLVAAPDTVDSETSNSSQNATNTTLAGNADLHISLEKVFRCDECSKSFGKLYLLKSHQAVHKGSLILS